jgi:hypothetical protein
MVGVPNTIEEVIEVAKTSLIKPKRRCIVVAFCVFSPPSLEHQPLIVSVLNICKQNGFENAVFLKNNRISPLKLQELRKKYPQILFFHEKEIKIPLDAIKYLTSLGYTDILIVKDGVVENPEAEIKILLTPKRGGVNLKLNSLLIVGSKKFINR